MDARFAELCGMHAGDGTIYRTNKGGVVWELRGGVHEQRFYEGHVYPLVRSLTDAHLWMGERSGGSFGVRCCTRSFVQRFLDVGFPIGSKSRTVRIPASIKRDCALLSCFLRGLFAADGCGTLMKINREECASYPVISFGTASLGLAKDVYASLDALEVPFTSWIDKRASGRRSWRARIAGVEACRRFDAVVGVLNPTHRARLADFLGNP